MYQMSTSSQASSDDSYATHPRVSLCKVSTVYDAATHFLHKINRTDISPGCSTPEIVFNLITRTLLKHVVSES